jgi:hypothetical protein
VNLDEVDTSVKFLGHTLRYPIFISSLTGGHPDVTSINRNLARAAEEYGLALGVGSQRAGIINPEVAASYAVTRQHAPHTFLIANIGAPQLIEQSRHAAFTLEQVQRAIDMIGANALAVHMNSLQEAAQPEGDRRAYGEAAALKTLTGQVAVPVIAKETGAGVCREQALLLRSCGVAAIDVGGAGGSSMSAMEAARSQARGDKRTHNIGMLYRWRTQRAGYGTCAGARSKPGRYGVSFPQGGQRKLRGGLRTIGDGGSGIEGGDAVERGRYYRPATTGGCGDYRGVSRMVNVAWFRGDVEKDGTKTLVKDTSEIIESPPTPQVYSH